MNRWLIILGPTATGKTDLALELAQKFNGELISCDSRQVYTSLDIGTGKAPGKKFKTKKGLHFWEASGIKIWMYDVVNPKIQYTVADYVKDSQKVLHDIFKRKKLPILVGGTGLYIRAILEGLSNLDIPVDQNLRKQLTKLSKEQLQQKLRELDQKKWQSLNDSDKQNPRRLIRAIELITQNSNVKSQSCNSKIKSKYYDTLKVGLTADRKILYERVDKRVVSRINEGMIEEAKELFSKGLYLERMRQLGLEYAVLADYLEGKIKDKEGLIKIMQGKIHGFVRRQLTWFKREEAVNWFDITDKEYFVEIEKLVREWYDSLK